MEKPKYDTIRGLSPTISIEQKPRPEILDPRGDDYRNIDYLRVLFARIGRQHCHRCGDEVAGQTAEKIVHELMRQPEGTRIVLMQSLLVNRKGEHKDLIDSARSAGFARLRIDGELVAIEDMRCWIKKKHTVEAVIDRLVVREGQRERITESVEQALNLGQGVMIAEINGKDRIFSSISRATGAAFHFRY